MSNSRKDFSESKNITFIIYKDGETLSGTTIDLPSEVLEKIATEISYELLERDREYHDIMKLDDDYLDLECD